MTVLYFAQVRRITGTASEEFHTTAPLTQTEFWAELLRRHPGLETLRPAIRLARNSEFTNEAGLFLPGDEIALIPPVSGG